MAAMLLATALAAILPGPVLADAELAALRGGFRLPSGIEVSLAVQTDTSVNGALLLRSVFTATNGAPTLTVLAPAKGQDPAVSAPSDTASSTATAGGATVSGIAGGAGGNAGVSVQFDRQNGVTLIPVTVARAPVVSVTTGALAAADPAAGLSVVPVTSGGAAVDTAGGSVSVSALPEGMRVRLEGAGIDVSHIVGAGFGSVIANVANDRTIDTTTTVSLNLGNAGPDVLGSTMFRVEDVAVDAARLGIK